MMNKPFLSILLSILVFSSCSIGDPTIETFGVSDLDTRGMIYISEIHWAGSVLPDGSAYNPNDDYIELVSAYNGALDIGGWTVAVEGEIYRLIVIPRGTVLMNGESFTIGNNTNGAFMVFDMIDPGLRLNGYGFDISIHDGGGQKSADSATFMDMNVVPAGYDLPKIKKSAIRRTDYFGALPGSDPENWVSYNAFESTAIVRLQYRASVLCSPDDPKGAVGESGQSEE